MYVGRTCILILILEHCGTGRIYVIIVYSFVHISCSTLMMYMFRQQQKYLLAFVTLFECVILEHELLL